MILVDLNQTLISSFMSHIGSNPKADVNENVIRHVALSTILTFKRKFGDEYGEIVLCDDDKDYWRREIHPYYKKNRIKSRKDSPFDWAKIFNTLDTIKQEIKYHFPYRLINIQKTEADDIIAVMCKYNSTKNKDEKVLIISNDRDFLQLQKYPNVKQYSPNDKRFVNVKSPKRHILEKVLRGDSGDGVPNVLSDADTFMVQSKRQTPLFQKKLDIWLNDSNELKSFLASDSKYMDNFNRNNRVINLDYIPLEIENRIIEEYESQIPEKKEFIKYFMTKKLKLLSQSANEF